MAKTDSIILESGKRSYCPIEFFFSLLGGKWKAAILCAIGRGDTRFAEIQRSVHPATKKMLTQQLRALEKDGLIARELLPGKLPRFSYSLTSLGQNLLPLLQEIHRWSTENLGAPSGDKGVPVPRRRTKVVR